MTEEPTQEQIKEFWEWCGCTGRLESIQPVPNQKEGKLVYVSPPIDLNNLFKYAVPKVKEAYQNKLRFIGSWKNVLYDWVNGLTGDPEKDVLALFWALRQVKEKANANR